MVSAAVGGAVYVSILRLGTHLLVNDAHLWGLTTTAFVYLSQFLMLSGSLRKAGGLSYGARLVAILLCALSMTSALMVGTLEVQRGYPELSKDMLADPDAINGKHFAITGELAKERAYQMSGNLGAFYLIPVSDFGYRILMMLPALPTSKVVRATGKLRADIRTVQRSKSGVVEGPFLRVYREDMALPENTLILFLDTSSRAGLNFAIVLWSLISLYLLIYFIRATPAPSSRNKMRFKSS